MTPITQNDKMLGAGINISAIFFPYMGPIVGSIIAAKSPYGKFHAYRSLIEQIVTSIVIGILIVCSLTYSIYSFYQSQKDGFDLSKIDWVTMLVKSLVTWLLLGLWGFINTLLAIRDAMQALRGELPLKPKWSERKALKWSGMSAQMAIPSNTSTVNTTPVNS